MESSEDSGLLRRKPKKVSFQKFLWNSDKKEFCGRTGTSWAKIVVFYLVFYSCLAGFFAAMMAIFYQTLDTENSPKFAFGQSILKNPALVFRPRPRPENLESTLIWYTNGKPSDIKHWVEELNTFISDYGYINGTSDEIRNCSFEQFAQEKTDEAKGQIRPQVACRFMDEWLQQDVTSLCHRKQDWGYTKKSPCIILKLNKIIAWEPDVYVSLDELPADMPKSLQEHITKENEKLGFIPPMAWVSCEGEHSADKEYLPNITMFPHHGFPSYYFPYTKNPNYRSPIVAVQFLEPAQHILITIECRIWAKNINHDRQHRLGMVHIELIQDDQ